MGALNKDILAELQKQNQLIAEMMAARTDAPAEAMAAVEPPAAGLMTDYDCLLICMSDDVLGAIDRWNKSRPRRTTAKIQ